MKANELMHGDIVLYYYDWEKIPAKVLEIYKNTILVESVSGEYEPIEIEEAKLFPIHLTPEILEKNGFKKGDFREIENQHTWTLVLDTIHYVSLWTRNLYDNVDEGWVFKAETSQVNGGLSLNAVHELQHALRLCGIEKEIEL